MVSRASMQYLYDEKGNKFLDCISNVQHVRTSNESVICNVRFVSTQLTDCAEQILATLPGLDTVLFCNSGSEANDLALRLARDYTKHKDAIVIEQRVPISDPLKMWKFFGFWKVSETELQFECSKTETIGK